MKLGDAIVICPNCGSSVAAPIELRNIGTQYVDTITVEFQTVSVKHECTPPTPDTDGLMPIERFVKHGALSDRGREHALSNRGRAYAGDGMGVHER